jgi:hypothetical protein
VQTLPGAGEARWDLGKEVTKHSALSRNEPFNLCADSLLPLDGGSPLCSKFLCAANDVLVEIRFEGATEVEKSSGRSDIHLNNWKCALPYDANCFKRIASGIRTFSGVMGKNVDFTLY